MALSKEKCFADCEFQKQTLLIFLDFTATEQQNLNTIMFLFSYINLKLKTHIHEVPAKQVPFIYKAVSLR